ncbi:MAG TPA: alpha/beta fold hydrolase [Hyphomonadaceae bacterium]|nr:alpha/beta fold hydrolase [Hyphomonadaceae bacterium]
MADKGGKPPANDPKTGPTPAQTAGGAADPAPPLPGDSPGDMSEINFQRLGQRIADLSKELADITKLAGAAAPRTLELEAAASAFKSLAEAYAKKPDAFSDAQLDLFSRQTAMLQELSAGVPAPEADADARFSDSAWRENPFFDFTRRIFLASAGWAEGLAWNAPNLSETERRRAAFFIRQASAMLAPSNLLMGNPKALKALFASDGQSIQRGFAQLQDDFNAGHGRLAITQSDPGAFEPGRNLAVTPGEVVLRNPLIELIRYHATTEKVHESPVLIFPPWINKYYVLDLTPKNSLVAWLRDQGFTVYMVSWRSADDETKDFNWDDYLALGGRAALDWVYGEHKVPVNAAGYCVGGALLSMMAARLAEQGDDRLASISLLAAQTDFSEPGDLGLFIDDHSIGGIEQLIADAKGVMPGEAMRDAFNLLRPEDLIWRYVEERYLLGEDPKPFDLLYWNSDQTNLPGPLHVASLRRLYLENALAKGGFVVEGKPVDLSKIKIPVFIHAARKDHISPFASVYKGVKLFGGDVNFVLADSGHIAGVVNPPAAKKYRYWTSDIHPPTSDGWMAYAKEHAGSWWPLWADWLKARSAKDVDPPPAIVGAIPAPGRYVRETLQTIRAKRTP